MRGRAGEREKEIISSPGKFGYCAKFEKPEPQISVINSKSERSLAVQKVSQRSSAVFPEHKPVCVISASHPCWASVEGGGLVAELRGSENSRTLSILGFLLSKRAIISC